MQYRNIELFFNLLLEYFAKSRKIAKIKKNVNLNLT